ncbi:fimbrial protein, partial [Salmonella enterica subsp. enterica]|nr:fimbrial protein [Salmonella enterica subsp. enterica serovar Chandans]
FYARMQKVLSNDVVVPGKLSSRVLVNVEYE